MEKGSKTDITNEAETAPRNFCLQASKAFEEALDENMGDPRLVIAIVTSEQSKNIGGSWVAAYDARDSRT